MCRADVREVGQGALEKLLSHATGCRLYPRMKRQPTPKKLVLNAQTIRTLRHENLNLVQGGLMGSTVPRSWCQSCETQCGSE